MPSDGVSRSGVGQWLRRLADMYENGELTIPELSERLREGADMTAEQGTALGQTPS